VIIKNKKLHHPIHKTKKKTKEKKQWPPSKFPKASGKRQKEDWKCAGKRLNRKKEESPGEKQINKELDLESNEQATSCEEVSQSPPSQEWCPSLQDMVPTSKKPVATHLSTEECELRISFGEALQGKGGQTPKKTNWREKSRVKRENSAIY
jgi:hypothetical protein